VENKVKIIVATHKKYDMPKDSIYLPLHVGHEGKKTIGYIGDNTGDNISTKNSSFCELTGMYWAWKNLDSDYLGLAHYRRHFTIKSTAYIRTHKRTECVLTSQEAELLVSKYNIILPSKRKYYIETLYSHYKHTHYIEQLDLTRHIIEELYPEYLNSFDITLKQTSGYMFNMFIMDKNLVDQYSKWLFNILFELEKRINMPELSQFQGRFYGRISEIIFNVWLNQHRIKDNFLIKEIGCIHMEKVNWLKKGTAFMKAKFFRRKYESGF